VTSWRDIISRRSAGRIEERKLHAALTHGGAYSRVTARLRAAPHRTPSAHLAARLFCAGILFCLSGSGATSANDVWRVVRDRRRTRRRASLRHNRNIALFARATRRRSAACAWLCLFARNAQCFVQNKMLLGAAARNVETCFLAASACSLLRWFIFITAHLLFRASNIDMDAHARAPRHQENISYQRNESGKNKAAWIEALKEKSPAWRKRRKSALASAAENGINGGETWRISGV